MTCYKNRSTKKNSDSEKNCIFIKISILEDFNLTWKAKGLLCFLISQSCKSQSYKYLKDKSYDKAKFFMAVSELGDFGFIDIATFKNDKTLSFKGK